MAMLAPEFRWHQKPFCKILASAYLRLMGLYLTGVHLMGMRLMGIHFVGMTS
jgi:hypothetical protein